LISWKEEKKVYDDLRLKVEVGEEEEETTFQVLSHLRDNGTPLCSRSQDYLSLPTPQERTNFLSSLKSF